jgi:hypothetical protein
MESSPLQYYRGLPIITHDEHVLLALDAESQVGGTSSFSYIADLVRMQSPEIGSIIEHDISQYLQYDAPPELLHDQKDEFVVGINDGYDFVLATITWTRFFRSEQPDIKEFIADTPLHEEVPKLQKDEMRHIKAIRAGAIPIEQIDVAASGDGVESSRDLALINASDYTFESTYFELLLTAQEALLQKIASLELRHDEEHPLVKSRIAGFFHGVENALHMYVLAREQRLLSALDFTASDE